MNKNIRIALGLLILSVALVGSFLIVRTFSAFAFAEGDKPLTEVGELVGV